MTDAATPDSTTLAKVTSELVAAYVSKNHIQPSELPALIAAVHGALDSLGKPEVSTHEPAKLVPPVSIKKSITDEYLISLEDGKRYQSLKRHLALRGLTPAQYREKWGLPYDYPMVAPSYAAKRSELAKRSRLGGHRRGEAAQEAEAASKPAASVLQPKPKRSKKAAE